VPARVPREAAYPLTPSFEGVRTSLGFVLSSTAAAAALYGAVVLFGLGPTSPVALGEVSVRPQPVVYVRVRVHEHAVPRPAARRPQASPGRAQHHRPAAHVQTTRPVQLSSCRHCRRSS
jgi:hypothetical protein